MGVRPIFSIVRQIGLRRLTGYAVLLVLALVAARYSHAIPLLAEIENNVYDLTSGLTAPQLRGPERVSVVSFDSSTLELTQKRSPKDRALLAKALSVIDSMHPRAIGIDMLFDQPQPEDPQLIQALRGMRTPTWIAFLDNRELSGACSSTEIALEQWQSDYLDRFFANFAGTNVHKTNVMYCDDPDFVLRRWPVARADAPLMAQNLVYGGKPGPAVAGPILFHRAASDPAADPNSAHTTHFSEFSSAYTRIPIQSFVDTDAKGGVGGPVAAGTPIYDLLKAQIQGRYILIGATVAGEDQFLTPQSRGRSNRMYGIDVHANAISQLLEGRTFAALPSAAIWGLLLFMMAFGALAGAIRLQFGFIVILLGALALVGSIPILLQTAGMDTLDYPAFGSFLAWAAGYVVVSAGARSLSSSQRSFAQNALGKYLPKSVAREILRNPDRLALGGQRVDILAVFTDLEGFTAFSDAVDAEVLSAVLNDYLQALSETVLAHGGTIDKFVGDAIIAFWGAPLAREDDAERAAQAAIALYETGERFRARLSKDLPPLGRTRVGLHRSSVVVGNFGGEGRFQYTAFGDAMNTASRLEAANKRLGTVLLVSEDALRGAGPVSQFRPMGRITVRGRSAALEVYDIAPDFPPEAVAKLTALYTAFQEGDVSALAGIESLARRFPADQALAGLAERLKAVGPGGVSRL
jgi:adenylate cyclase